MPVLRRRSPRPAPYRPPPWRSSSPRRRAFTRCIPSVSASRARRHLAADLGRRTRTAAARAALRRWAKQRQRLATAVSLRLVSIRIAALRPRIADSKQGGHSSRPWKRRMRLSIIGSPHSAQSTGVHERPRRYSAPSTSRTSKSSSSGASRISRERFWCSSPKRSRSSPVALPLRTAPRARGHARTHRVAWRREAPCRRSRAGTCRRSCRDRGG